MRHLFSRPMTVLLIILVLTAALPCFSLRLFDDTEPLPAAFCLSSEPDADAEKLCRLLDEDGLLNYRSADELSEQVRKGRVSIGLIIPGDLGARLSVSDIEGVLTLLTAQPSALEVLQKTEIMSALYEVLAPYITCDSLKDAGFSFEKYDVFSTYERMEGQGLLFSFEQCSVEGNAVEPLNRLNIFRFVLGLMLWIGMLLGVCVPACRRVRTLEPAIGRAKAWKTIGIPALTLGYLLMAASALFSCMITGFRMMVLPAMLCLALMGLVGLAVCLVFPGSQVCTIVCVFMASLAPAFCPALADISLFIPLVAKVRFICPVYWMWM